MRSRSSSLPISSGRIYWRKTNSTVSGNVGESPMRHQFPDVFHPEGLPFTGKAGFRGAKLLCGHQLLNHLNELSVEENYKVLASSSFAKITDIHSESRRIQKVQNYINERYQQDIRLNQLAELVGMAPSAFSRFFKLRTGKTLSDYITDIRIGYAARMLVDTQRSIAEICYDCGFNNLSNFNRIFKKKKNCSPKEFRDNYKKTKIIV